MIVLVRHAETEWSVAKRFTGRTDLPLLPEGRDHAATLPRRLGDWTFGTVLCSPLRRARETAELAGLLDRAELVDDLMEWDYGDYEGRTRQAIEAERPGWDLWTDGVPSGESPADVAARCDRLVTRVAALESDVAVVAHGHLLRSLTARWCEQDLTFGGRLRLDPAAVCVLDLEHGRRAITRWNVR